MCKILKNDTDVDSKNWIIALRHDESHLNKYICNLKQKWLESKYKVLSPEYLYPEWWNIPFDCKILIRDKSKYIDVANVKNFSFFKKLLNAVKNIMNKLYKFFIKW
jgi:hypothetical protein